LRSKKCAQIENEVVLKLQFWNNLKVRKESPELSSAGGVCLCHDYLAESDPCSFRHYSRISSLYRPLSKRMAEVAQVFNNFNENFLRLKNSVGQE
jgi:hypothetical protein